MFDAIRTGSARWAAALPLAELLGFWGGVQMGFPAHRHTPSGYAGTSPSRS